VRVVSQLDPRIVRQSGQPAVAAPPAAAERPAPADNVRVLRRDAKPASESQIERLGKIRKVDKLWEIIDQIAGRDVRGFEQLTYDQAKDALNTFYETFGGGDRGRYANEGRR
jgi:hypothetical protein